MGKGGKGGKVGEEERDNERKEWRSGEVEKKDGE